MLQMKLELVAFTNFHQFLNSRQIINIISTKSSTITIIQRQIKAGLIQCSSTWGYNLQSLYYSIYSYGFNNVQCKLNINIFTWHGEPSLYTQSYKIFSQSTMLCWKLAVLHTDHSLPLLQAQRYED